MRPLLFLPEERVIGATSDLSGFVVVISLKSEFVMYRRLGVTGLYDLIAIILPT
jgi:hypothetical protein